MNKSTCFLIHKAVVVVIYRDIQGDIGKDFMWFFVCMYVSKEKKYDYKER